MSKRASELPGREHRRYRSIRTVLLVVLALDLVMAVGALRLLQWEPGDGF